jgi:hypothetical protein
MGGNGSTSFRLHAVEVIQPRAWKGLMPIKKKKYLAEREMLYFRKERSQAYAESRVDFPWSSVSSRDSDQGSSVLRG